MKKVVRLTESDLVRLVKKVIKENEFDMDMGMGIGCDEIIDGMDYVYDETMRYYKNSSPDTKSVSYTHLTLPTKRIV